MKIGIITWHEYQNFGSDLQAFALQKQLCFLGYDAELINYRVNYKKERFGGLKNTARAIVYFLTRCCNKKLKRRFAYCFPRFQKKYYVQSRVLASKESLRSFCSRYNVIICGSDQIWAPNVFDPVYMIDFVDGRKAKKISYAASIGLKKLPDELVLRYRAFLGDFYRISVREKSGQEILQMSCQKDSKVVLDPTLLLSADIYRAMEKKVKVSKRFVFCYFLNANNEYRETVEKYARDHDCIVIGWSAKKDDTDWMNAMPWIGPCEFLYFIDHSECVFTDSYHGTIFSLLFHKEFWHFKRFTEDDPICQNSRIEQLNIYFDISKSIISPNQESFPDQRFDYNNFDIRLDALRSESLAFLKEALG